MGLTRLQAAIALVAMTVVLGGVAETVRAGSDTLTVFAAASTTNAVTAIGAIFSQKDPVRCVSSFASSSTLAKQIENGAPADIFISANPNWMDYLAARQLIAKGTRVDLLHNRIVLVVPCDSGAGAVSIVKAFDLMGLVGDSRLAMGDPDHVPAGIYGKQALEWLGVWSAVEKRVARAKDVRAALALVERGEAAVGLVYATDAAISDKVRVIGTFPAASHAPIVYPVAVVAGKRSPATDRFMKLLQSPEAKTVFIKYGFTVR